MADDDSGGFDLQRAIDTGADAVETITTALGIQREAFTCPDCGGVCEQATTHDPQRAAFDGGESPSWYCEACDCHYVREADGSDLHALDLYGRGRE